MAVTDMEGDVREAGACDARMLLDVERMNFLTPRADRLEASPAPRPDLDRHARTKRSHDSQKRSALTWRHRPFARR